MSEPSQQIGEVDNIDVKLPENLVAEARRTFHPETDQGVDDGIGVDERGSVPDVPDAATFAFHQHIYVTEYIKLADQKAAVIFAAVTGMLCYFFNTGLQKMWLKPIQTWSALDFLCLLAMLSLAIGLCAACAVLVPLLRKSHRGLVFFGSVAEFESSTAYASEALSTPHQRLTRAILQHTYDLSKTCSTKYTKLVVAIWGAIIGTVLSVLVLLFKQ